MAIWERYFLKEILKVFSLFLFCFFFLYAILDYSAHMQDFIKDKQIAVLQILLYYTFHFLKRAPLLIPLALLITTIKVLTTFNASRELVALQASGLNLKKLLKPFFLIGLLSALFNWVNMEYLFPSSLTYIDRFHDTHFKHSYRGKRKEPIGVIHLADDSKLIYQAYDSSKKAFFDVLWLRSADDIWRIKTLSAEVKNPRGEYIDHLQRNKEGLLEKSESFPALVFPQIKWQAEQLNTGIVPIENRSIGFLAGQLVKKAPSSYKQAEIVTQLTFKSLIPLLSLVVIAAAAPFCVRYSRGLPLFFIYLIALFGFLAFYALMNSAVILGENNTLSPFWTIFIPFAVCSGFFSWKFARMHQ